MSEKRRRTGRGFQIVEFVDRYNAPCELQQSSLADFEPPGSSAVWLGLRDGNMHLDLEQVKWLIEELQHGVDNGEFRGFVRVTAVPPPTEQPGGTVVGATVADAIRH